MTQSNITVSQTVAILIDGNNIERSIEEMKIGATMLDIDKLVPELLGDRSLNRLIYFREGHQISSKLAERLHEMYYGTVVPCHKSADIPLTIKATQLAPKVDTIVILSGDADYVDLVKHLRREGVRVEIAAVEKNTSHHIKEAADYFFPITKEHVFKFRGQKKQGRRQPRRKQQPKKSSPSSAAPKPST